MTKAHPERVGFCFSELKNLNSRCVVPGQLLIQLSMRCASQILEKGKRE